VAYKTRLAAVNCRLDRISGGASLATQHRGKPGNWFRHEICLCCYRVEKWNGCGRGEIRNVREWRESLSQGI